MAMVVMTRLAVRVEIRLSLTIVVLAGVLMRSFLSMPAIARRCSGTSSLNRLTTLTISKPGTKIMSTTVSEVFGVEGIRRDTTTFLLTVATGLQGSTGSETYQKSLLTL